MAKGSVHAEFIFGRTWLVTHTWTMSGDVTDVHGDRAVFASGKEVQCHFVRVCFGGKRGLLAFWEGAPSAQLKKPSRTVKKALFEPLK